MMTDSKPPASTPMPEPRILIVSFRFPPFNSSGAVRLGETARHLHDLGADVRVISARNQPLPQNLEVGFPKSRVTATRWINLNRMAEFASGGRRKVVESGYRSRSSAVMRVLARIYRNVVLPDPQIGWVPFAVLSAWRMRVRWRPEIVYASAPPLSSAIAGVAVAACLRVPLVIEFRDLWGLSVSVNPSPRERLHRWIEKWALRKASGAVTVSEQLATRLRDVTSCPVAVVQNGFDASSADFDEESKAAQSGTPDDVLKIVYTGMIYPPPIHDPEPLFQGLQRMRHKGEAVRIHFYGKYHEHAEALARKYDVHGSVVFHGQAPRDEALDAQRNADILLLFVGSSNRDAGDYQDGIFSGKLFEYLGARRPICLVGPESSAAAKLVVERRAGRVVDDPESVVAALSDWIDMKQNQGSIERLPRDVYRGLTRLDQTEKLSGFLVDIIRS